MLPIYENARLGRKVNFAGAKIVNSVGAKAPKNVYIHCVPKKLDHQTHSGNILIDFQNCFTVRLSDKFAIKVIVKDPTTP